MKKNFFLTLVSLMIISIVAIISVQVYWIISAWEDKEEEFSLAVSQSLNSVSVMIEEREMSDYIAAFEKLLDSVGTPNDSNFTDVFLFMDDDMTSNLTSFYAYGILEENYILNIDTKLGEESNVKDYKKVKTTTVLNNDKIFNRENKLPSSIDKLRSVERINTYDQVKYRAAFSDYSSTIPIHRRLNVQELQTLLEEEFKDKNILTYFEFGIYNNGLATKVKSNNYKEEQKGPRYEASIFTEDGKIDSPYKLVVSFPEKNKFVFSSIISVAGLSILLTFFIIIVSATAIYQIIQQKKVSEMKSDFINNMSHEFKTPIATINLALDAISNAKILSTPSKVKQYVQMIREENKRMLTQVESVLLISRLEKSSAPIAFSEIDLDEAIHNAIRHVDLLVKSKKGSISTSFEASDTIFRGNLNHITNLIINLLDNSIKYSDNPPKIRITTSNTSKHLVFTIADSGIGMDLTTQKFVFEKFYREQSGNIHNIKGHGLGLSYVKKIVDLHNGSIDLFSNVGKGTTFTISFPKK